MSAKEAQAPVFGCLLPRCDSYAVPPNRYGHATRGSHRRSAHLNVGVLPLRYRPFCSTSINRSALSNRRTLTRAILPGAKGARAQTSRAHVRLRGLRPPSLSPPKIRRGPVGPLTRRGRHTWRRKTSGKRNSLKSVFSKKSKISYPASYQRYGRASIGEHVTQCKPRALPADEQAGEPGQRSARALSRTLNDEFESNPCTDCYRIMNRSAAWWKIIPLEDT